MTSVRSPSPLPLVGDREGLKETFCSETNHHLLAEEENSSKAVMSLKKPPQAISVCVWGNRLQIRIKDTQAGYEFQTLILKVKVSQ